MRRIKQNRLTSAILIVLLVFTVSQIIGVNRRIDAAKAQRTELTQQLRELQSSNAALKEQIRAVNDPKTRENIARERLGLILPGEIIYKER